MIISKISSFATHLYEKHPLLTLFVFYFGAYRLFTFFDALVNVIMDTIVPRKPTLKKYKSADGERVWALVTGCTAGIGEQYAIQLAKAGFNVALVSRNPAKLATVSEEIAKISEEIKTRTFVLDAQTAGRSEYEKLSDFARGLGSVSVLVNNLGVSHEMPVPFGEVSTAEMHEIIQVNCVATLEITRAVLPALEKHAGSSKSARSLILTMGSFAGLTPTPLLSVYSGSKAFLQGWSSALAAELQPKNIDVRLVVSYLVTSKMSKIRRTSLLVTDPEHFVASTLRQTGVRGGAQERAFTLTPYWSHAFMHFFIERIFGVYSGLVAAINYNMHVGVRKRALRKKAKTN